MDTYLVAFDDYLIVHGENRPRSRALIAALPKVSQGELEAVDARPLHRAVEPVGEPRDAGAAPAGEGPGLDIPVPF